MTGEDELRIGEITQRHSMWAVGRDLGEPVLNDDGRAEALVDLVFPNAQPRAVMEVTRVVDGDHRATHSAAVRAVEQRLRAEAVRVDRGQWWFFLAAGAHVKSLEDGLIELMKMADPPEGTNLRGDDLPSKLTDAGLISVGRERGAPPSADIATMTGAGAVSLRGLSEDLSFAIGDNIGKLRSVEGHERHLTVWNQALRAGDPGRTPVPLLPDAIDYLWVIRTREAQEPTEVLWIASHEWSGWKIRGEAHQ